MNSETVAQVASYSIRAGAIALWIVISVFVVKFFIVDIGTVSGPSMTPAFADGKLFLAFKAPLFFRDPQRFEIVQMIAPSRPDTLLIKRVIGLPGETVTIKRNAVCISKGTEETCLTEPYVFPGSPTKVIPGQLRSVFLPPGAYFVLGDNRAYSFDSREFGPIPRSAIIGAVVSL